MPFRILTCRIFILMLCCSFAGCNQDKTKNTSAEPTVVDNPISHPGNEPWIVVPDGQMSKECGLDEGVLNNFEADLSKTAYAIIRYGKLCKVGGPEGDAIETYPVMSVTKTLSAALFGIIATRTEINEDTYVSDWLSAVEMFPVNSNAKVMHLLGMTATSPILEFGLKTPFLYDPDGTRELNRLLILMDRVVKAFPNAFPGSKSIKEMAINELFLPLGMNATNWPAESTAIGMNSSVLDMARLGLLLLRKGRWGNTQIIDEDYVYRMTHPSFEDVNTGYGYLTWLNALEGNAAVLGLKTEPNCSPFATWQRYPHPASYESPDNGGGSPFQHIYDIGVFWADGAGGQMVYVHRGLDLVLVIRDDEEAQGAGVGEYHRMWRLVRPALVAKDPVYAGDETAFCDAYRRSEYAPDLYMPWSPESGFGFDP